MTRLPFSPVLLFLDFIGALLSAIGVMEWVHPGMVLPEGLHFPYYAQLAVVLGVALMVPFILDTLQRVRRQRTEG